MTLPTPDPAEGAAAQAHAAQARRTVLHAITTGAITVEELFTQVALEEPKHQLGHIHARALLLALPRIGEVKADGILDGLGIPHDRHLAALSRKQRAALIQEAIDHA